MNATGCFLQDLVVRGTLAPIKSSIFECRSGDQLTTRPCPSHNHAFEEFELSHPKGRGAPGLSPGLPSGDRRSGEPGWADGLRKLYNSVVDEPLPGSFDDILKKLDESDDG